MESWNVHEIEESTRLDVYLAAKLSNVSRARIQRLIAGRDVSVNGAPAKPNTKLRSGDHISISIPDARPLTHIGPEEIDLDVVYEDPDLIVINKAKGMVVHPAPGSERGTLVNALLARIGDLSGIGGASLEARSFTELVKAAAGAA